MKKFFFISITIILALIIGMIMLGSSASNGRETGGTAQNVEVRDGVQYVTVTARGGYFPRTSSAKAGIPTKLVVKTNGTYDCSAALVIRSLGYQKILPQTGEEVIDLGVPEAGKSLQGLCSMGMYNFVVNFD